MRKLLMLSYKGEREYIQGGDIFNALADIASEVAGHSGAFVKRLAFRRFTRMACEVTTEQPNDSSKVIGQVRFGLQHDSSHRDAWLVETGIDITTRQPFDEASLLANARLDEATRSVCLPSRSPHSPVEDVIALTKHLNYAISPEISGKWVLGQLELTEPLTDSYQALTIQMKNLIAGHFSANEIVVDGRRIGSVRFIVGEP